MDRQPAFAAALLDPAQPCPAGLRTWNGSDPARRFQVYRNNVIVALIDALADTFPVTRALVGEEFFAAMARRHALAQPPASPVLALYGGDFAEFIAGFPPAAGLPYLPDLARLEYRRVLAYHAADLPAVAAAQFAAALADPARLPGLGFALHPSLAVLASPFAVVSLWAAHQGCGELAAVRPGLGETALILRCGLDIEVIAISPATGAFIAALQAGDKLGAAAAAAQASETGFDLAATLGLLLQKAAITALHFPRRSS